MRIERLNLQQSVVGGMIVREKVQPPGKSPMRRKVLFRNDEFAVGNIERVASNRFHVLRR
ncbi:hypothetical protein [Paracoccus sp. S3-43]|uniref:hypothetical protein n=1 Tax=Paracoccus sp. S3-43 TaxID=3030011 RepID=UPI0023B0BD5A|nr:hypothetical protein [Paracoccus sp. S3-43]WEF25822.1 hypothetical protein PXD02_07915 [Paracoccus sp. S3-43]